MITEAPSERSLSFDGATEWMAVLHPLGDSFAQTGDDPFSISAWVKLERDSDDEQIIINRWLTNPHPSLGWLSEAGYKIYTWSVPGGTDRALTFFLGRNKLNSLWLYSDESFPLDEWVHVVMAYDGTRTVTGLKMYWNGKLQSTTSLVSSFVGSAATSNAYSHLLWGCGYSNWWAGAPPVPPTDPPTLGGWFQGKMDHTILWDDVLTQADVDELLARGKPRDPFQLGSQPKLSTLFAMGDPPDGDPFLGLLWFAYGQYLPDGVFRNAFWNVTAARAQGDVAAPSFSTIREALDAWLADYQAVDVAWENAEYVPTRGTGWLRPTFLPGEPEQGAIGSPKHLDGHRTQRRAVGIYQVSVFEPAGEGQGAADVKADTVMAAFSRGLMLKRAQTDVRITRVYRSAAVQEKDWYHVPVTVAWEALTEN